MLNLEVLNKKVAVCVIAYNEINTIEKLVGEILAEERIVTNLFIYTDGSTDGTSEVVKNIEKHDSGKIVHIMSKTRRGKQTAYNCLLGYIEKYDYAIFFDADVHIEKNVIQNLVKYLDGHTELKVVASFLIPTQVGHSKIPGIYQKVKEHIYRSGEYKYFTGRAFIAHTRWLPRIPIDSQSDDFYLNLKYKSSEIGVCRESEVYYVIPHTTKGMFLYSYYIGSTMTDIRDRYKNLWKEQLKRISLLDYVVFGLTRKNFGDFWRQLDHVEKVVFIYSRLITMLGFVAGYVTRGSKRIWKPIEETKTKMADL